MRTNEFGQAIGDALPDFTPGRLPAIERIEGRYTVIERLSKEKTWSRSLSGLRAGLPSSDVDLSVQRPCPQ